MNSLPVIHTPTVDNHESRRRRQGHAVLAAQARRALGVSESHHLADVPLPLVHAALGLAACAVAFLVRVPALGLLRGGLASGAVAVVCGGVLLAYDRLVLAGPQRPSIDGAALPVAAVGGFAIVLAASLAFPVRLLAAVISIAIIGGVPHIGQRELAGHHDARLRFVHDVAGIVVVIPFVLAGVAADTLIVPVRLALVAIGCCLVAFDGLRIESVGRRSAAIGSILCGLGVAIAAGFAHGGGPGTLAGLLILAWYGLRGMVISVVAGRRGVVMVLEYLGFTLVALLALAWVAR